MQELGTESKQEAYVVVRATLQSLRDRLPLEEAAHLGAQLPMYLLRGVAPKSRCLQNASR